MDFSFTIVLLFSLWYFPLWYPFIPAKPSYLSPVSPDTHENMGTKKVFLNLLFWLPFPIGILIAIIPQSLSAAMWLWGGITVLGMILIVFIGAGLLEKCVRSNALGKPSFDERRYLKIKRFLSFVCLVCLFCGVTAISSKVIVVNVRKEQLLDDRHVFLFYDYSIAILYMMYCGILLLVAKKVFK